MPVAVPGRPPERGGLPASWWWFLVPLLSLGMGTFVIILVGGLRTRSRLHLGSAVFYFLCTTAFFIGVQYTASNHGPLPDAAVVPVFVVPWLAGIAHALVLQLSLAHRPAAPPPADPAISAAAWRARRRQDARAALAGDPGLATELRIGRPDLPGRQYDDGGLVDVNHVPAACLVAQLDLPPAVAECVVSERALLGGFSSPDELPVYCPGLTAERLAMVRDRLVFIPF
jgi:hypothetical protein